MHFDPGYIRAYTLPSFREQKFNPLLDRILNPAVLTTAFQCFYHVALMVLVGTWSRLSVLFHYPPIRTRERVFVPGKFACNSVDGQKCLKYRVIDSDFGYSVSFIFYNNWLWSESVHHQKLTIRRLITNITNYQFKN